MNTSHEFDRGDRVLTPGGVGTVASKRMAPPSYARAEVYSVILDSKRTQASYNGTIYQAADVTKADPS